MKIKKQTIISVETSDGKVINEGDTVIFEAAGFCVVGVFLGLGKKGQFMFRGVGKFADVTFNIMPSSVKRMYLADVTINEEFPMNPPVVESEE